MILTIDVETTGLDPTAGHAVVELAAVALQRGVGSNGSSEGEWGLTPHPFTSLVAPGRRIPAEAAAVHHLREIDVVNAPKLPNAMAMMLTHAGLDRITADQATLAAHNAAFDRQFLDPYLAPGAQWLCTYRLASHLYPSAPSHQNQALRYHLGLDAEVRASLPPGSLPHRALPDAITTAVLLKHMLAMHTLQDLLTLQGQPILQRTVRFGKYRNQPWAAVPKDYLQYILRQNGPGGFDPDIMHTAKHFLEIQNGR